MTEDKSQIILPETKKFSDAVTTLNKFHTRVSQTDPRTLTFTQDCRKLKLEFTDIESKMTAIEAGLANEAMFDASLVALNHIYTDLKKIGGKVDLPLSIIERNLQILAERAKNRDNRELIPILQAAAHLVNNGYLFQNEERLKNGLSFLTRYIDRIEQAFNDNLYKQYFSIISSFAFAGQRDRVPQRKIDYNSRALEAIEKRIDKNNIEDPMTQYILDKVLTSDYHNVRVVGDYLVMRFVEKIYANLPPDQMIKYFDQMINWWKHSAAKIDYGRNVLKNLIAITQLEKELPGSTLYLIKTFGIHDFARYPLEMLKRQYLAKDDYNLRYGLIIDARDDWNSTRSPEQQKKILGDLLPQLPEGWIVRIIQGADRKEILRKLIIQDDLYGQHDKAYFVIIRSHGNKDLIKLSDKKHGLVQTKDFRNQRARRAVGLRNFLTQKTIPTIIVASCETGIDQGLSQKISEALRVRVLSSKIKGFLQSVHVQFDPAGIPIFNVRFNRGLSVKEYIPGATSKHVEGATIRYNERIELAWNDLTRRLIDLLKIRQLQMQLRGVD